MLKAILCLFFAVVFVFISLPFISNGFDSSQLMKDGNTELRLSSLTNFKWDYAVLWANNEDFKKLDFYKDNVLIYSDNYSVAGDGDVVSQYLFENKNSDLKSPKKIDAYKCSYIASIKFKNKESLSEGRVFEYNYEPASGCVPQEGDI
jgi:hypothetical protein